MPKYVFKCSNCKSLQTKYAASSVESLPCSSCKEAAVRQFPNIGSKKVTETVDPFLGIRHEEDHKKQMEDRRTEYFWEVEVPRLVESGTYSLETMLENGWVEYNEKGELVLGKPKKKK